MANSKIYLGSASIGSLFQGASDISIYLGEEKVYPLGEPSFDGKFKATYSDSTTYSAACDSSTELTSATTKPSGYEYTVMTKAEIGCVTNINPDTFKDCTSLTSVTIGSGVTKIGQRSFMGCTSLPSIAIPDSVTRIDIYAFYSCASLTSVTIGNSVTTIGNDSFGSCTSLTSIDIPNSVTSIEPWAFEACSGLTSVTIGSGVTKIDTHAFDGCTSLESITCNAITPPTLNDADAFQGTPIASGTGYIYVPDVDAYKSASGWSSYADRIQAKP